MSFDSRAVARRRASAGTRRRRSSRQRQRTRRSRRWIAWAALPVLLATGAMAAVGGYVQATLPSVDLIGSATGTVTFTDRNGAVLSTTGRGHTVSPVKLDQVAPVMQQATVAAEDRNFWTEGSIDLKAVARAVLVDTFNRKAAQGASTITEQLAKLAFLNPDKTALRKVRETLLGQELSTRYSKSQILEMYLNLVYYGHGAYGIEQASQVFFGKHARDLNLREASLLAGVVDAPSYNDPFRDPGPAFARQHYVLSGMVKTGAITRAVADAVDPLAADPAVAQQHQQELLDDLKQGHPVSLGPAPHFVDYASAELQRILANDPAVLNQNLTVMTTLDSGKQAAASTAVATGIPRVGGGANNGALLMVDAHSGEILAMVGSAGYTNSAIGGEYNMVTAQRRPGSSFKPYVYATAFSEKVLGPYSTLLDTASESQALGGVKDFDNRFYGPMSAARALVLSRNVPAEQAMAKAGVSQVIDMVHRLGITTNLSPDVSTAIGSSSVSMLQHATAYAALANGGTTVSAASILKVTAPDGKVVYQRKPPAGAQVLSSAVTCDVTNILKGYAGQWGLNFRQPTAGKSGTTDNFVDAWYMAYTPDWVVATWAGHTDGGSQQEVPMRNIYGVNMAPYVTVPFVNTLPRAKQVSSCRGQSYTGSPTRSAATPVPAPTVAPGPASPSPSEPLPVASPSVAPSTAPSPRPSVPPPPSP